MVIGLESFPSFKNLEFDCPSFKNLEFNDVPMEKFDDDVPIGWRFMPTDEELITSYLSRKVAFQPLPAQTIIKEIDANKFYTNHPNKFVGKNKKGHCFERVDCLHRDPCSLELVECWYLLIHNDEYSHGRIRKMKLVGDEEKEQGIIGCWKSSGKEEEIFDNQGNVFACKIHYTFFTTCKRTHYSTRTHWKMEQYRLPSHHHQDLPRDEWVMARIKRG